MSAALSSSSAAAAGPERVGAVDCTLTAALNLACSGGALSGRAFAETCTSACAAALLPWYEACGGPAQQLDASLHGALSEFAKGCSIDW